MDELNVIYREIGYSNTQISSKEKLIFNSISDSITGFFEQANQEREKITSDNHVCQNVLQRILQVINDPKGTATIPDLYTRNVIISGDSQAPGGVPTSPKKPTSLLNKQKTLSKAKSYVIKTYTPKLSTFLDSSIRLKSLAAAIKDFEPEEQEWGVSKVISVVPPLDTCKYYKSCLGAAVQDIEKTSEFIVQNRQALLNTINFNDVSDTMVSHIDTVASMFEKEFDTRMKKLYAIGRGILGLLKTMDLGAESELDENDLLILRQLSENQNKNTEGLCFFKSNLSRLEKVFEHYKRMEHERRQEKNEIHEKCSRLWVKLKVPQSYSRKFESDNEALSTAALKNYNDEFERLQEMKKKLIKNLIEDSWIKIQELWAAMHFSSRESSAFKELYISMTTRSTMLEDDEKVLETCEAEVVDLERRFSLYKPILKLIDEFKSLQNDKLALERSSKDSSRLLLRNSHRILLEEERTRKRITRHFPDVIQELTRKLIKFEEDSGKPFMVEGARFLDIVREQGEEILSKYPRSRVNSAFKSSATPYGSRPKVPLAKRSPNKDRMQQRKQPKSHRKVVHNVPMSVGKVDNNLHVQDSEQSTVHPPFNRYMRATRMSSPIKSFDLELTSMTAMRSSPTKIPTLNRSSTFPRESSIASSWKLHKTSTLGPKRLMQISPNRLNTLPSLNRPDFSKKTPENRRQQHMEPLSESTEGTGKENRDLFYLQSPAKIMGKAMSLLHSPPRESENSVYTITKSPEGKFTLSVNSNPPDNVNVEGDDTSIMADDDNFANWKRERLARLNNNESTTHDVPSCINWDTDVF